MIAELPPIVPRIIGRSAGWIRDRRRFAAIAGVALAALAGLIAITTRLDRQVALFESPLATSQISEIAQAMTLWNEPFSTNAAGTQLFVPAAHKRDVLLRLVVAGLPHRYAPTSADVLQTPQNPLTPESIVDDRRRAGIEGDLVAGLRRVAGVADASVFIAPSSGGPFDDESMRSPPSASVQLIVAPGSRLAPATIAGIGRFVAAAYPGLAAQRVTVVDGNGVLLSGAAASDRAATKEAKIQYAVQTALDAVLGAGAAIVRVSARTTGVAETEQSTRVTPHGLLDSETGHEHGSESGRAFEKEKITRHYAYDTMTSHRTTAADVIRRLSVAVFLDARRVDGSKTATIATLVRAAAGADLGAGDEVVVQPLAFAAGSAPSQRSSAPASGRLRAIVPAVVLCVFAMLGASMWPRVAEMRSTVERGEVAEISRHLMFERPHTAAHVLRTLPPDLRMKVLRSWDSPRRTLVQSILDDSRDA